MYFLRGSLPCQGIQEKNNDERYKKILQKKVQELCKDFQKEFEKYIDYTGNMEYEEDNFYIKLYDISFSFNLSLEHPFIFCESLFIISSFSKIYFSCSSLSCNFSSWKEINYSQFIYLKIVILAFCSFSLLFVFSLVNLTLLLTFHSIQPL